MPTKQPIPPAPHRVMRIVLLAGLAAIVLVLGVNSYDSGIFKTPLFVVTALLLAATVLWTGAARGHVTLTRTPADIPVAAMALLTLAGFLVAPFRPPALQALLQGLACVVVFFAATQCFDSRPAMRTLLSWIGWLAAVVAAFGLIQYFFSDALSLEFYLGPDRRIGSTLGNPAFLGGFVVLVAPLILATALSGDNGLLLRRATGVLFAALMLVLLLTRSRSSIIACGISLVVFFLVRSDRLRLRSVLAGLLLLTAGTTVSLLLVPGARERVTAVFEPTSGSTLARRWFFWEAGARAFMASPLWGHGTGSFEAVMMKFRSPNYWVARSEDVVPHAHNEIIETGAEFGVLGLALSGWMLWVVLRSGLRQTTGGEKWKRPFAAGLLCGIVGVVVDNLANVSLRQAPVAATAWLFAGILSAMASAGGSKEREEITLRAPRAMIGAALLGCAAFLWWYIPLQLDAAAADRKTISGLMHISRGEDGRAVQDLRDAGSLNPTSYVARSALAGELLKINRPADALAESEALRAIYPDYPRMWLMSAVGLLGTGRIQEAGVAIRKDLGLRDHPEGFYVQALICRAARDTACERASLRLLLERCLAGNITMHADYAAGRMRELCLNRVQCEETVPLLEKVSATFPSEKVVRANLDFLHRLLDRPNPGQD